MTDHENTRARKAEKVLYTYYRTTGNRVLHVSDGISRGKAFGTFYRTPKGNLKRFKSPQLPMRPSAAEAQADLDAYARTHMCRVLLAHNTCYGADGRAVAGQGFVAAAAPAELTTEN